ncbi:heat-shock protein [Suttonella sp. R2A3]|uniref:RNA-binding S4 domain-containing protein n=1 Tax=Suttonella sp. R2A3 TaxID=2908648 RepID=UPI001F2172F3|nr:S4 domain-containing protein [Suttonella sp. R2A3]UJF25191.1 heat-shock protein [Suttonella sp. R2A3]
MSTSARLDQWLWAARFYKSRPLAVNAIKNGRVQVNGQRAKPARQISEGDTLYICKQAGLEFDVVVLEAADKRVSASIAQTFYRETEESIARREALQEQMSAAKAMVDFPNRRPDKRDRRNIRAIKHHREE